MTEKVFRLMLRYKHINWALLDQALVSGTNFLTTIIIARCLGVEEFGKFALAWMVVQFMNGFQTAFIVSPVMSVGPKIETNKKSSYYGAVFLQQLLLALVLSSGIFFVIKVCAVLQPGWGLSQLALVVSVVNFFYLSQDFIRRYFFVLSKFKEVFITDLVSCLGRLALLTVLFNSVDLTVGLALWSIALTSAIAWVIGFIVIDKLNFSWSMFYQTALRHWMISKWLIPSVVVQWVAGNLFLIGAASILGFAAVGALKAMQNILGVFNVLFSALENIVPVRAAVIYAKKNEHSLINYLVKVAISGGIVTVCCIVVIVAFPRYWVDLFYGEQYLEYAELLFGYGVAYLLTFVGLIFRVSFRTVEHTRPIFQAYLFSAIISLVSFYPLIVLLGVQGVVVGLVIVQIAILSWYFMTIRKEGMFGW